MASTRSSLAATSPLPLNTPNGQSTPQSRYSASLSPAPSSLSEFEELSPVQGAAPSSSRSPELQRKRKPSKRLDFGGDGAVDESGPKKRTRRTKEQMEQDRQAAIAAGVPEYKAKRPPKVYQQLLEKGRSGDEPKSSRSSSFSEKLSKLRVEEGADGRASPALLVANTPSFSVQPSPHNPPQRLQEQHASSTSSPRIDSSRQPSIAVSAVPTPRFANANLNDTSNSYTSHKVAGAKPVSSAPQSVSDNMKISDLLSSDQDVKPSQPSRSPSNMHPYQYSQQARPDDRNVARYSDGTPYRPYESNGQHDQRSSAQQQYQSDYRGQQQAYAEPPGGLDRVHSSHGYNQNGMYSSNPSSMGYYSNGQPPQHQMPQSQYMYPSAQVQSHSTIKPPSPPRSSRAFDPIRSIASTTTHTPASRPSPLLSTPNLQPQSRSSVAPSISNLLDLSPGRNHITPLEQTQENRFPNMVRPTGAIPPANDRLRPVEVIDLADDSDVPARDTASSHRGDRALPSAAPSVSAMDVDMEASKPATARTTPESKPKVSKKKASDSHVPTISNLSRAASEKPGDDSASSETATTAAVPKKRAPVVLPPSLPPLPGQVDLFKSSDPIEEAPCIYLHVPLIDGESNRYVNFAQLAEKTYGFAALHPRIAAQKERLARVAAVGALLEGKELDGDGMNLDNSDDDAELSNLESAKEADTNKQKKKRLTKEDMYDKDDPFVDDTELAWEQAARASTDGFFVYMGPLVQDTTAASGGGTGKGEKGESKRSRAKTDGKGKTTKKDKEKEKEKDKGKEKEDVAPDVTPGAGTPNGKSGAAVGRPKKKPAAAKADNAEEPKEKAKRKPKEKAADTNTNGTPSKAVASATAKSKEKDSAQMDVDRPETSQVQPHVLPTPSNAALPIVMKQAPSPFDLLGGDTSLAFTSNSAGSSAQRHPGPSIVDILD